MKLLKQLNNWLLFKAKIYPILIENWPFMRIKNKFSAMWMNNYCDYQNFLFELEEYGDSDYLSIIIKKCMKIMIFSMEWKLIQKN